MPNPLTPLIFFMPVQSYDVTKLPVNARDVTSAEFRNAVAELIHKTFEPFGGNLDRRGMDGNLKENPERFSAPR